MQPDTSTFTNAATRHQPTPNSTTCAEWPSESAAVFNPQLHSLYLCLRISANVTGHFGGS